MTESKTVEFNRRVPVRHDVDVFVAGGGPAGVAAAVAAARQGASVFLAEGEISLGGTGTSGGVAMFCVFTDGVNFVADGVGRMIYDRVFECGGASPASHRGDRSVFFKPEVLKRVYDELLADEGVSYALATHVIGLQAEDGRVSHVVCSGKSGLYAVRAGTYVDATGDGDLCVWAGARYEKGDAHGLMQPGTYVSLWSGVDWERAEAEGFGVWKQDGRLKDAIADGALSVPDPSMPGILPTSSQSGHGVIGHLFGVDGTDERSLTEAAIHGRKTIGEYESYYKTYLKGYENLELIAMAARLGIRETRRITGDYVLTEDDYWNRATFDDEIGRYCYGIDMHARTLEEAATASESFDNSWLPKGESYGIPYRTLTPAGLQNVLVAGRCISVDQKVLASVRVMPGCFITGQAAGVAAAMTAEEKTDIRGIDVKELRTRLADFGAYLPNVT